MFDLPKDKVKKYRDNSLLKAYKAFIKALE